jgi:RNA polymerase primary sigma factor
VSGLTTEDTEVTEVLQTLGLIQELFKTAKESVSIRNYRILILRYGLDGKKPQTLQAVGKRFNISKSRVDQIAKRVIRKTRSAFRRKLIFQTIAEGGK